MTIIATDGFTFSNLALGANIATVLQSLKHPMLKEINPYGLMVYTHENGFQKSP